MPPLVLFDAAILALSAKNCNRPLRHPRIHTLTSAVSELVA